MRPTIQLVISLATPEHHSLLKKVRPRERYLRRDEAYIIGTLRDQDAETLLVIREPEKGNTDINYATRQAIQLFQPNYAFLLGTATGVPGQHHGEVVISNQLMTEEEPPGNWMHGHTDQHLAHYLDSLQDNEQQHSPFRIGRLIGKEDSLLHARKMYPSAHWAIAPQAEGFFTALKSAPMVSSLAILGINQPQANVETLDETLVNPCEQAVNAALELWRHMAEVRV